MSNKSFSILLGSVFEDKPILLEILFTCVSTAIPTGVSKASNIITFALFLPIPASVTNLLISFGNFPIKFF